jgi:hypothetical protein
VIIWYFKLHIRPRILDSYSYIQLDYTTSVYNGIWLIGIKRVLFHYYILYFFFRSYYITVVYDLWLLCVCVPIFHDQFKRNCVRTEYLLRTSGFLDFNLWCLFFCRQLIASLATLAPKEKYNGKYVIFICHRINLNMRYTISQRITLTTHKVFHLRFLTFSITTIIIPQRKKNEILNLKFLSVQIDHLCFT